jgi:hypothetical protein
MAAVMSALGVSSTALSKWISTGLTENMSVPAPQQEWCIATKIIDRQEVRSSESL